MKIVRQIICDLCKGLLKQKDVDPKLDVIDAG